MLDGWVNCLILCWRGVVEGLFTAREDNPGTLCRVRLLFPFSIKPDVFCRSIDETRASAAFAGTCVTASGDRFLAGRYPAL